MPCLRGGGVQVRRRWHRHREWEMESKSMERGIEEGGRKGRGRREGQEGESEGSRRRK